MKCNVLQTHNSIQNILPKTEHQYLLHCSSFRKKNNPHYVEYNAQ